MDKKGTILVVDDSPVDLSMLTEILTSAGFAVSQADSGEVVLASIAAKKPDLVLLDILMPVMDGFEVCRQLKAQEESRDIPVIFLSSADDVKDKIEGFKLGAIDYVNKPFQGEDLLARVGVHIEIGRLTRELKVKTMQLEESNNNLLCKEEQFRLLVDNSLDAVMLTIPDGTILSANKAAEKMFGLSEKEICRIGRNGIIDVTDSRLPALVEERMRTGRIHGELTGIRSDGTRFPIEFTSALFSDHEGNVRSSIIIRDITERKGSEESLARSEAEFRRLSMEFHGLLDAIPDSLMLIDRDMKLLWANKASIEAFGVTSETITDQYCSILCHENGTPCEPGPAMQSFSTGKPCNETVNRPDGSIWDIRTVPLTDEQGSIVNVIELSRDITEHRKLEDQLRHSQKMESVGTLAGGIAHDFNNILTAIIGYGNLALMKMQADDPLRHDIGNMLEGADRAARLTSELLQFSRKQAIERKPVDLNMVVVRLEKFLIKVIGEDIAFKTVLHETPIPVLADEHHLEQVLMNLATNARDAMPRGGALTVTTGIVTLTREFISAHGYGKLGTYAHIIFADTGMGMDEATQQRIFEPFFTTKEIGKGTGLGLAITYGIIKQHDGYIIVYSEPGRGTVFRIYLPIILSEAEEELPPEQETAVVGGAETILLAEDDEAVRTLIRRVLTEFGYTIIEAVDGSDAVSKFLESRSKVDLLLLDIIMPKMNGKEAFDEIRKIRPEIKAIFSSGYAPETIRQKASLAEDANLITKPISPTELLRKVRCVLDGEPIN